MVSRFWFVCPIAAINAANNIFAALDDDIGGDKTLRNDAMGIRLSATGNPPTTHVACKIPVFNNDNGENLSGQKLFRRLRNVYQRAKVNQAQAAQDLLVFCSTQYSDPARLNLKSLVPPTLAQCQAFVARLVAIANNEGSLQDILARHNLKVIR